MAKTAYTNTFNALHTLWTISRYSSRAKTICKSILGEQLKFPCQTRWNSRFDCIKQCNKPTIQSKLNQLIIELKSELNSKTSKYLKLLSSNDMLVMQYYEKVLGPIAKALDVLQGDRDCYQGDIMPVLVSMKFHISQLSESHNLMRDFKQTTLKLIDNRFGSYFEINASNKEFILASMSLPRYKSNFIRSAEDKLFAKNLLLLECKTLCNESDDLIDTSEIPVTPSQHIDDFIVSFESNETHRRNSIENEIECQVSSYLSDGNKDNNMLLKYSNVRAVFYKYNTTLPSSAAVERVFSQSQLIFQPRRNRISKQS